MSELETLAAVAAMLCGTVIAAVVIRLGWAHRFWDWVDGRPLDPLKALYGSEDEYRRLVATHEAVRLADTYPPRVQEALDLVERETAAYERKEREAACGHERAFFLTEPTYANPQANIRICPGCERVEYFERYPAA